MRSTVRIGTTLAVVAALLMPAQLVPAQVSGAAVVVSGLVTNGLVDPLGIGGQAPGLSWQLQAARRGVTQTAFEVHVATSEAGLESPDVWDSGKVVAGDSLDVGYGGPALSSSTRYVWAVRVWDDAGVASPWSSSASFETGLLDEAEWTSDWIGVSNGVEHSVPVRVTDEGPTVDTSVPDVWVPTDESRVPAFRKGFTVREEAVVSARIYASAQGVYELQLNGEPVGDHEFAPGWTDYARRIQYQTYDVTELIQPGDNAVGAELGTGWFAGRLASFGDKKYGSRTAFIAQLRIEYADGTVEVVGTDGSWRTTDSAIVSADFLDGERYDARRAQELAAWSEAPYDDSGWRPVAVRPSATRLLEPQTDQPARITQHLAATAIASPQPGVYLYDLGQNMVGNITVTMTGQPGQTAQIRYGEVLNPDGTLYVENLRSAKATDSYTFASASPETYTPQFTFHGFRYVEITGVDTAPPASGITGLVISSAGELTSELQTSSPMVNQLHDNIVWGQRGNFLSIPTDCPQRDERMGWTGDINVFAPTAVVNMDSQAFLTKWLEDLRDTQRSDGAFPGVAPLIPGSFDGGYGFAGWADAGVNVPWTVWQAYGDTGVVEENYAAMKRYVDYLTATSNGGVRARGGYSDWLNLDDPTPAEVLDTAFMAKSTRQFAEMAAAVGNTADATAYSSRYDDIRTAFIDNFIGADGTVRGDSQTAYIVAITNDLVPDDRRDALAGRFVETIQRRDWHLSTGFLGVAGLLPALSAVGRTDVAYRLLENTDYPSWGYEIGHGATTIWERWNSIQPDGSFGPSEMNSFNHYAYGAVGEWMYGSLAGVSALEPGYRSVLIAPKPGGGITSSEFSYDTRYGRISSAWAQSDTGLTLDVAVPANTTATVRIPAPGLWAVTEGGAPADIAEAVRFVEMDDGDAVFEVGSGFYQFTVHSLAGGITQAGTQASSLVGLVDELGASGQLPSSIVEELRPWLGQLADAIAEAERTYLATTDSVATATQVHAALAIAAGLTGWITAAADDARIDASVAEQLTTPLRSITVQLSSSSSALLGVAAGLVVTEGEHLPGEVVRVHVVVENTGTEPLAPVFSTLQAPAGWTVTAANSHDTTADPAASLVHPYDVHIPADASMGVRSLTGIISYSYGAGIATVTTSAVVDVVSTSATYLLEVPESAAISPGQQLDVDVVVRRIGGSGETRVAVDASVDGELTVTAPQDVTFTSGARAVTVAVPVTAALDVTVPSSATLVVTVAGERREIPVQIGPAARLGTASASSTMSGFIANGAGANNGNRDSSSWSTSPPYDNGWNDNTIGAFPDWLRIDFTGPVPVGRVDLYTLDSTIFPAALWGIRDADIELLVDGRWQKVAEVRTNLYEGLLRRTFEQVTASAVRVVIHASNDQTATGGASRIIELEVYPA